MSTRPDGRRALPVGDIDADRTLAGLAVLPRDPTVRRGPGRFERASLTPAGPAAYRVVWGGGDEVVIDAWGDGAAWVLDRADGLLGLVDDPAGFEPTPPALRDLWRRHPGLRVARSGTLWHDLAAAIVQQRVTIAAAAQQWAALVATHGVDAPGPLGLRLPPEPERIADLPYSAFHSLGIERKRADHLRRAAAVVPRLAGRVDEPFPTAERALRSVPGIGPWTAGMVRALTWGDPDTVVLGDDGIPSMIAWLLAGERRADDARMVELLEPYRGHRYRVLRLAFVGGVRPPRRHHRRANPRIRDF